MNAIGFRYFIFLIIVFYSCNSNIKLIDKNHTKYGSIKFYSEREKKGSAEIIRIYASVENTGIRSYYSFYPDRISKTTDSAKELIYVAFFGQLPKNYDFHMYQKFSSLDSLIFKQGDNILDSLGLINFKRSKGAEAYSIEVNYYHGYPKNKKFRP